jgi:hypothetical protein
MNLGKYPEKYHKTYHAYLRECFFVFSGYFSGYAAALFGAYPEKYHKPQLQAHS